MSAIVKTMKRRGKKPGRPVSDDLVNRYFTAGGANRLWNRNSGSSKIMSLTGEHGLPGNSYGQRLWSGLKKYHRKLRQSALGRLTPVQFESMISTSVAVAARLKLPPRPASDPAGRSNVPVSAGFQDAVVDSGKSCLKHPSTPGPWCD